MFGLPLSTEFNRRIPKQKFYANLVTTHTVKKLFTEQIKSIFWRNKLAAATLNIAVGRQVIEIEVFEINLVAAAIDDNLLLQIDRAIPYHTLFLLEFEGKYRVVIGYKVIEDPGNTVPKVDRYYHTDWIHKEDLHLHLDGLTMDSVYENLIRRIAGRGLQGTELMTLKESVEWQRKCEHLEKQIATLQRQVKSEKQPKKKFELVTRLKEVQSKWQFLKGVAN